MFEKPCGWHVNLDDGRQYYCEAGSDGHKGSHFGERSAKEYVRLLERWIAADTS